MRARNNTISNINRRTATILNAISIEQEEMLAGDGAPAPKKKSGASGLLARVLRDNNRYERTALDIPKLGPLGDDKFWDFKIFPRTYKSWKSMNKKDKIVAGLLGSIHGLALLAPFTYTPAALGMFFWGYMLTCQGITMSFHRQLTHRSFTTPKWVEYSIAFLGVLAVQGDPIEWCSAHRHHHVHCDDLADPHSPYDGFWWSHMGWMFDSRTNAHLLDTKNIKDLSDQKYY